MHTNIRRIKMSKYKHTKKIYATAENYTQISIPNNIVFCQALQKKFDSKFLQAKKTTFKNINMISR